MPSPELFCGNTSCGVRFGILGSNPREETSAGPEGFARNKKSGFEMDMNLARGLEQEIIKINAPKHLHLPLRKKFIACWRRQTCKQCRKGKNGARSKVIW